MTDEQKEDQINSVAAASSRRSESSDRARFTAMQAHKGNAVPVPTAADIAQQLAAIAGSLAMLLNTQHEDGGWKPPPQGEKNSSSISTNDVQRIARSALHGAVDDALESAGSLAGGALGPLGALGGGLLARELGSLLGLHAHRQPRGESAAQPIYVVMPGVSELLSELVSITRAAQLRSAAAGIDQLTSNIAIQNLRAGLIPEVN